MDFSILPKVDLVMAEAQKQLQDKQSYSHVVLARAAREAIASLRIVIAKNRVSREQLFVQAVNLCLSNYQVQSKSSLRRVINATGVILHTNLGRAPLHDSVARAVYDLVSGYCNLELNLLEGKRGSRHDHVSTLLQELTGAEDALVVNNNAAAVLVTLATLAKDKEIVISRGQLVEIGGSFRIPEIIECSGAVLREVGTTNKTHHEDYEKAIGANTACVLQVHPSNYQLTGFVEEVATTELARLAHEHDLPLVYDLGSGCLYPFAQRGIGREPLPSNILAAGTDVLTFSGDKLLGGPQAGIIVGKKHYLKAIRQNQLLRALRVDKMTIAALEATLVLYRDNREREIPTVAMLTASEATLKNKSQRLQSSLAVDGIDASVQKRTSPVGGGSLPEVALPAYVVEIATTEADQILRKLRTGEPAVLAYIREGKVCFDTRTVTDEELEKLERVIKEVME